MSEVSFDRAEPVSGPAAPASAALACRGCKTPLSTYYAINGVPLCEPCLQKVRAEREGDMGSKIARGALFGFGGMIASAALYGGVRIATNYNIGLIAIAAGFVVGWTVRKGIGRGSTAGQGIAVVLTYLAIVLSYIPEIVQAISEKHPDVNLGTIIAVSLGSAFSLIWRLPVILAENGPISILIGAFAIYQAWKMNRAGKWVIDGPLQVGTAPIVPSAGAVG
jgi:hypothetical protein